jgi:dolichyl-phosphate beta-glucosyltransferase
VHFLDGIRSGVALARGDSVHSRRKQPAPDAEPASCMVSGGSRGVVVVVPCYNEARRLDSEAFAGFARAHEHIRFLFVDDGSADQTTSVLRALVDRDPARMQLLALERNQGKSEAVRQGLLAALQARPQFVGYWDADLATPLDVIRDMLAIFVEPRIELVMGARVALLGRDIRRHPLRHYAGRMFAAAASMTINLPVYDTQCGAKLLRVTSRTAHMLATPFNSRWIFDVELLARHFLHGGKAEALYEWPLLSWTDVGDSRLRRSDFVRAMGELLRIYRDYPLKQPLRGVVLPFAKVFGGRVAAPARGRVAPLHAAVFQESAGVRAAAPEMRSA